MTADHALYRFYDVAGRLLYVGISLNPGERWKQHQRGKVWWREVAQITIHPCGSRRAALDAERTAIVTERPAYNVIHNRRSTALANDGLRCDYDTLGGCGGSSCECEGCPRRAAAHRAMGGRR